MKPIRKELLDIILANGLSLKPGSGGSEMYLPLNRQETRYNCLVVVHRVNVSKSKVRTRYGGRFTPAAFQDELRNEFRAEGVTCEYSDTDKYSITKVDAVKEVLELYPDHRFVMYGSVIYPTGSRTNTVYIYAKDRDLIALSVFVRATH